MPSLLGSDRVKRSSQRRECLHMALSSSGVWPRSALHKAIYHGGRSIPRL